MKLLPERSELTRPYWDALHEGRLVAQECGDCGRVQHPPLPRCGSCHSAELSWRDLAGTGTIYSYTIVHHAAHQALADKVPYAVGLVELDEGPRVVADFVGDLDAVLVGARVEASFEPVTEEISLAHFVLAGPPPHDGGRAVAV